MSNTRDKNADLKALGELAIGNMARLDDEVYVRTSDALEAIGWEPEGAKDSYGVPTPSDVQCEYIDRIYGELFALFRHALDDLSK